MTSSSITSHVHQTETCPLSQLAPKRRKHLQKACAITSPQIQTEPVHTTALSNLKQTVETILAAAKPNWKRKCATSIQDNLGLENECLSCLLKQKLETNQNASFALSAKLFDALF